MKGEVSQDLQKETKRGESERKRLLPRAIPYGYERVSKNGGFLPLKVLSRLLTPGEDIPCFTVFYRVL